MSFGFNHDSVIIAISMLWLVRNLSNSAVLFFTLVALR